MPAECRPLQTGRLQSERRQHPSSVSGESWAPEQTPVLASGQDRTDHDASGIVWVQLGRRAV